MNTASGEGGTAPFHPRTIFIFSGIMALALIMQLPGLVEPRFWQDEMISLGVAGGSFIDTIVATLRLSAHPPAYYAQLNLWMLGGKGASYIILNSVVWSIATVAALFYAGRKIIGEKTAAAAAFFYAVMPQNLYFAENARMYAMICFLQILGWLSVERVAGLRNKPRGEMWRGLLWLSLAQLLIGFAHGIGPIYSACLGLFGLARLLQEGAARPVIVKFLGIQTGVGAILVLVLINGLLRETQHQPPENLSSVLVMLTHVVFGPLANAAAMAPITFLIYLLSVMAFFLEPRLRLAVLVLVILPIGASIITTVTLKPILSERPLALTLPFIALACAATLSRAHTAARQFYAKAGVLGLGLIVAASLFISSIIFITRYEKPHDFRSAAADLARDVKPGDSLIAVESPTILWGLSWYLLGPESVSALRVQSPPNERWQAMYNRLGNDIVTRLGLNPGVDTLMWNGMPMFMGLQGLDRALTHKRVWLAYYDSQDMSGTVETLQNNGYQHASIKSYRGITIRRFDAPGEDFLTP